ncbi:uncharacterized protein TRIVIDRAFT_224066 [Trichoderma virens Gv29-8]|uniref:Uncharacterized protein n=1 Tax=Hypocrea virens (strain Gv29-8 / FGSC 10586) TaxID=413071 RepID=G9MZ19_HYPVG|nr:uncharacterized protein TRIVIDRAFT_224066 [Trichoderma virens Gv29-8]EHK20347.1 hypothetical protein TRIVIDRAFT_224066 [Trichoderma virens Gv29-8]UKZ47007.1 hypothetical protein TrVGV298_001218 [Trichoderma virens]
MKHANVLLFYASLLIECATAAVRSEILYHHQRRKFQSNTSIEIVQHGLSTAASTAAGVTLSELADPTTKHDVLSISETASVPSTDNTTSSLLPSSVSPSTSSPSRNVDITGTEIDDPGRTTPPPATEDIRTIEVPTRVSTSTTGSTTGSFTICGNGDASECSSAAATTNEKLTFPTSSSSLPSTSSTEPCTPLASDKAVTEYSIVYTSTVTFYGNSTDYTPPYSPITTPNYCSPAGEALITVFSTTRISNSTSTLTVIAPSSASPSYDLFMSDLPIPLPTFSIDLPETITQTPDAAGKGGGGVIVTMRPFLSLVRHVVTFITTDKNPSVVFSPEPTPVYSQTWVTGDIGDGHHKTVEAIDDSQSDILTFDTPQSVKQRPVPTFQLTAGGEQVIINSKTVSNLKPGQTTTVTVGNEVFTIFPTAVVGLGSTITKPAPQASSPPIPAATSGTLGGIPVIVSGTQAIIDGNTVRIPLQETTTSINGQRVVLGAGTIAVGRETLILPSPQPTHEIVTGGEMLTAIGTSLVVLHSTTITYGLNMAPNQTVINGETISIGPRGISLHGTTIGGPSANAKATEYEIVGGITVGKVLPSLVVVNGATYAINQDGDLNNFETTVIDNQTITIGPSGLVVSSQTLTYPGSSVTATLSSSNRALTPDFPVETGGHGNREDGDESGAFSWRRDVSIGSVMCFFFVISVWILA